VNQKRKSSTFNNGQRDHLRWNRPADGINIRMVQIIQIPNLLSFQIFPAPHLLNYGEFSKPPIIR